MTAKHQATLRTDRIALIPLDDAHLEHEIELDTDPEITRYITGRQHHRDEVVRTHGERLATAKQAPGLGWWAGFVEASFAGLWLLKPPKRDDQGPADGQAEIGYRVPRRYWRRGLAREGARELVRHGFDDLALNRIFAETMIANERSVAIMKSLGMVYVRTLDRVFDAARPGGELGAVEYALTRAEWADRHGGR